MNNISLLNSNTYIDDMKRQLNDLSSQEIERIYLHIGGRLIGDNHAARVLPRYDPDTKLHLVRSLVGQAEFVYCVSAKDLDRSRIRGDNGLDYTDEVLRSLDELLLHGIIVGTIVIVGTSSLKSYEKIVDYAKVNDIRIVPWSVRKSILDDGFTINQFQNNKQLKFQSKIIVALSPGSNSGKFDFCLEQLYLDKMSGHSVAYARLQIFPILTLHPWHPVNLAYFAATADTYSNEHLFSAPVTNLNQAWSFYQKDKKLNDILGTIAAERHDNSKVITRSIVINEELANTNEAEREGAAEILRRYMRYRQEVELGQERVETLVFTRHLVDLLFDRYPPN